MNFQSLVITEVVVFHCALALPQGVWVGILTDIKNTEISFVAFNIYFIAEA